MNNNTRSVPEDNILMIDCKDIILREYIIADLDEFHALTWRLKSYKECLVS